MSGIYVHIPFCKQKCIYCGFYSIANSNKKNAFLDAVDKEIELTRNFLPDNRIHTLYFGGGTPSLFNSQELAGIVNQLAKYYCFDSDWEFTLEANPEQLTTDYLLALKSIGVNRLSIGVQSFNDAILRLIRRRHTAEDARRAVENASHCGFDNISIDLIYDIAPRSVGDWRKELATAFSLPIVHLSAYALTVEENTLLSKKIREGAHLLSDEDENRDFFLLQEMCAKAGFEQYEISNFAKDGKISQHNSSYWNGTPYLGIGPSAHSYDGETRKWNIANLDLYLTGILNGEIPSEKEILTATQQYNEYVLLRLRTCWGINIKEIEKRFGAAQAQHLRSALSKINPQYYRITNEVIQLTTEGKLFADAVALDLFDE